MIVRGKQNTHTFLTWLMICLTYQSQTDTLKSWWLSEHDLENVSIATFNYLSGVFQTKKAKPFPFVML